MLQLKTSAGIFLQTSRKDSCLRLPDYSQGGVNKPSSPTSTNVVALLCRCGFIYKAQVARACTGDVYQTVHGGRLIAWHTYMKSSVCRSRQT